MFKKLFVSTICVLAMASVSIAKDGPFPMLQSLGLWQTNDTTNLSVTITAGHSLNKGKSIQVHISIRDSHGELVAFGDTIHNLKNKRLEINLVDYKGRQMTLTAKPVYKSDHGPLHRNYSLAIKVVYLNGEVPEDQFVLERSGQ